jgi:5-methyltetrahydropteroyltriglutamate--homocysteine methyltransferase
MVLTTTMGFSPMGSRRQTKFAVEAFIQGELEEKELENISVEVRRETVQEHKKSNISLIPSNTFTYYDFLLDEALMFNIVPPRFRETLKPNESLRDYFKLAKKSDMTRWFNTNYYVIAPEFDDETRIKLVKNRLVEEYRLYKKEFQVESKPVIVGPVTFMDYSKVTGSATREQLVKKLSKELNNAFKELESEGCKHVQVDEPILVKNPKLISLVKSSMEEATKDLKKLKVHLHTYFGKIGVIFDQLMTLPVYAVGFDLTYDESLWDRLADNQSQKKIILGVIDGRSVWKSDLKRVYNRLIRIPEGDIILSTSASLMYVPHTLENENMISEDIKGLLSFAVEKLQELDDLSQAVGGSEGKIVEITKSSAKLESLRRKTQNKKLRDRIANIKESYFQRLEFNKRKKLQDKKLELPLLHTTTIGSFPQIPQIRKARSEHKNNLIKYQKRDITETEYQKSEGEYESFMKDRIRHYVKQQEDLGLDVLVHGEPERNDMVEYFSDFLNGFATTENGWVKSYGTRCVKPPIIYGDVSRKTEMTTKWITYAQSLTKKPVKGMFTGPATIHNWSFTPTPLPSKELAYQIALAIRDECTELEKQGIKIIQIDEPALIERMPYDKASKKEYLDLLISAFNLASSGVKDETMIVTHMCYGNFEEIYPEILDMEADIYTFEFSNSGQDLINQFSNPPFTHGIGVGVLDVHTPEVESVEEIKQRIKLAIKHFPISNISINPDCGLKTRGEKETLEKLKNMVAAVRQVRKEL